MRNWWNGVCEGRVHPTLNLSTRFDQKQKTYKIWVFGALQDIKYTSVEPLYFNFLRSPSKSQSPILRIWGYRRSKQDGRNSNSLHPVSAKQIRQLLEILLNKDVHTSVKYLKQLIVDDFKFSFQFRHHPRGQHSLWSSKRCPAMELRMNPELKQESVMFFVFQNDVKLFLHHRKQVLQWRRVQDDKKRKPTSFESISSTFFRHSVAWMESPSFFVVHIFKKIFRIALF